MEPSTPAPAPTPPMPPSPPNPPHHPLQPTEPYPHHDLPLEVSQPPAGPLSQTAGQEVPQPQLQPQPKPQPAVHVWGGHQGQQGQYGQQATPDMRRPAMAAPAQPPVTPPPQPTLGGQPAAGLSPVPVVRVLSPVGVEYVFLTFTLLSGAVGLASALIAMVNGAFDFAVLSFPAALLLVSVPVFAVIFLHLKKLELLQPALRLDPSKRRSTQFTQIAMFMVCFFTLIGLTTDVFAKLGGQAGIPIGKAVMDAAVVLLVAGGILAYYWNDEHRNR